MRIFADRREAGRLLANQLQPYAKRTDVQVLALPRGGVPVADEVARVLDAPLDVFVVRKIGAPWNEELAIGALASGGVLTIDEEIVRHLGVTQGEISATVAHEREELERRERLYRDRPFPDLAHKTVILIDDGLATGATMRSAVQAIRTRNPERIVVAVPVGVRDVCEKLRHEADVCVCVETPEPFIAVGAWYRDFTQTTDEEVRLLLERAARRHPEAPSVGRVGATTH